MSQQGLESFHKFGDLPAELRRKVWFLVAKAFPGRTLKYGSSWIENKLPPVPPIMQVCRESRDIGYDFFKITPFVFHRLQWAGWKTQQQQRPFIKSISGLTRALIYTNYENDLFEITALNAFLDDRPLKHYFEIDTINKMEHLCIHFPWYGQYTVRGFVSTFVQKFYDSQKVSDTWSLKRLVLIFHDKSQTNAQQLEIQFAQVHTALTDIMAEQLLFTGDLDIRYITKDAEDQDKRFLDDAKVVVMEDSLVRVAKGQANWDDIVKHWLPEEPATYVMYARHVLGVHVDEPSPAAMANQPGSLIGDLEIMTLRGGKAEGGFPSGWLSNVWNTITLHDRRHQLTQRDDQLRGRAIQAGEVEEEVTQNMNGRERGRSVHTERFASAPNLTNNNNVAQSGTTVTHLQNSDPQALSQEQNVPTSSNSVTGRVYREGPPETHHQRIEPFGREWEPSVGRSSTRSESSDDEGDVAGESWPRLEIEYTVNIHRYSEEALEPPARDSTGRLIGVITTVITAGRDGDREVVDAAVRRPTAPVPYDWDAGFDEGASGRGRRVRGGGGTGRSLRGCGMQ